MRRTEPWFIDCLDELKLNKKVKEASNLSEFLEPIIGNCIPAFVRLLPDDTNGKAVISERRLRKIIAGEVSNVKIKECIIIAKTLELKNWEDMYALVNKSTAQLMKNYKKVDYVDELLELANE